VLLEQVPDRHALPFPAQPVEPSTPRQAPAPLQAQSSVTHPLLPVHCEVGAVSIVPESMSEQTPSAPLVMLLSHA
jgi:hypothetical protein